MMKWYNFKKIDLYIVRKFLGSFFYSIALIIVIAIIFDTSEKLDDFMEKQAPLKAIVFDYYLNFIPYFVVLYSHLFTFISVVFFTSKMAYQTEIIAILGAGVSYKRLLKPYMIAAAIITVMSFVLTNFIVPNANKKRLEFEERYIRNGIVGFNNKNIHRQIEPGLFVYFESYSNVSNTGYEFSLEKFDDNKLKSKLMGEYVYWDSIKSKWIIKNYYIRYIRSRTDSIVTGESIDTTLRLSPAEFRLRTNAVEAMNFFELNSFITDQKLQGSENVDVWLIEKYKRIAVPLSTFILTIIGVAVSSRKVRGGTGLHIGIGMAISFAYILSMSFASQFAIGAGLDPMLAAWIPNIIFSGIAYYLYRLAPK